MKYILKASSKAFIINAPEEMIVTSDYQKATQYAKIGDAMRAAVETNKTLGTHLVRIESIP